jgi:hypothetical protein
VPPPSRPLRKLGFLSIGLFDEADPGRGHESTLDIIGLGERLGFDSAWVRHRHLQYGWPRTCFAQLQLAHIRAFRAHHPDGERARVSQGLVVIPTDSATAGQRAKYAHYAEQRLPRTATPQGPRRMLFAPDLAGPSAQLADRLSAHAAFREVDEVAFALPFTFDHDDHVQILTDLATRLGPALGWHPAG